MTLALNTTMRACEIRGLRWRDVDFREGVITVTKSKTESGKRVIPLNADAYRAILELQDRTEKLLAKRPLPDWYVFPHAEGGTKPDPTHAMSTWRTAWRRITREAGLHGLRFHDLRHHAITELAESATNDHQRHVPDAALYAAVVRAMESAPFRGLFLIDLLFRAYATDGAAKSDAGIEWQHVASWN
jgi:integrase